MTAHQSTLVPGGVRATLLSMPPKSPLTASKVAQIAALGALLVACGGERAPAAPGTDGGPRDASVDGTIDASMDSGRPSNPILPPADIELVLPFGGPSQQESIFIDAQPGLLDVHFSVDTTGSFLEEIDAIQADLDVRIIPALQERVGDVGVGVSRFEDFPEQPFGGAADWPFRLLTAITSARGRIASAVAALDSPIGSGADGPESGFEALYQIATGDGYRQSGLTLIEPFPGRATGGGTLGGAGFRDGALKVVVHITDAPSHVPADYAGVFDGTHGASDVVAAMGAIDGHIIGIASGAAARPHLEALAVATDTVATPTADGCPTGISGALHPPVAGTCPLVFDANPDGTGVSEAIVDSIVELIDTVQYGEVYGRATDDDLRFVRAIEAADADPPAGISAPTLADRRPPGDGFEDTFLSVRSGTRLRFDVHFQNLSLLPADYDQVFRVTIEIVGGGLVLSTLVARITVPFSRPDGGVMDASPPDGGMLDATADGTFADAGEDARSDVGDAGP